MSISSHHITDFLKQKGTISLEKIGTLSLPENPQTNEEGELLAPAVFVYDKRAETTPEFANYLSEILHKPLLLVQSDLEYFLDQSRQLMNIGSKPLKIDGIGYIHAENNGVYSFSIIPPDGFKETELHKKYEEAHNNRSPLLSKTDYASKRKVKRNLGRWVLALLLIALIASGLYYVKSTPSFLSNNFWSDSTKKEKVAAKKELPVAVTETSTEEKEGYKFIIQVFDDLEKSDKRVAQLKNYGNTVSRDSAMLNGKEIYRLYVTDEKATPADTLRIKDSLRAYFGHNVIIE